MKNFWSIESWGDACPPENADEIIDRANELIEAFAESHDDEETANYSESLWERYCSTGSLMKLYFVESGTADNYIMSVSEDGVCCDNCAPDGKFSGISLYSYDENGEKISGEAIARAIREALDQSGCSIEDFDLGDPCYRNFEEWEAEQAEQEYFNRDKAFLI